MRGRRTVPVATPAPDAAHHPIDLAGGQALGQGDVAILGRDVIHSVVNPIMKISAGLHVYGGDFFAVERSQWDPATLAEQPFDARAAAAMFTETNRLHGL